MRYNNLSVKQYDKVQSMASSALLVTVTVMLGGELCRYANSYFFSLWPYI